MYACTWIELYILYRICGYVKPIQDRPHKARGKATADMQLKEFKNIVRGVVERAIYDEDHKELFRPTHVTHERLLTLGIKGRHPTLSFGLNLEEPQRKMLEEKLIALGHKISGAKIKAFKNCKEGIQGTPLSLKGRAGWDSKLDGPRPSQKQCDALVNYTTNNYSNTTNMHRVSIACLSCPDCNAYTTSDHPSIQLVDLDKKARCDACRKYIKAKDWNCKCNIPWHLCSVHCPSLDKHPIQNLPSRGPCRGTKRIPTMAHEELRELDNKRSRKVPPAILPPQTNILSPGLREKFAHLLKR